MAAAHRFDSDRGNGHREQAWEYVTSGKSLVLSRQEWRTTEEDGPVWFGELGWSGSWRMGVESTPFDQVRITAGYNPFDFAYKLSPGESLETPLFCAGFTQHGNGGASRLLHRFQLQSILPQHPSPKPRPIIYNSWEATGFAVDQANQPALAEKAAKLGVE